MIKSDIIKRFILFRFSNFFTMYRTKEMRWFFKKENKHLKSWFAKQMQDFKSQPERTDIYLDVKCADVNIKLREGNIEIKQRQQGPRARAQLSNICGYCEKWTKWSFTPAIKDAEYEGILKGMPTEWITVGKNRLALMLIEVNGKIKVVPTSANHRNGCQIEYTVVTIGKKIWYTFGLEWFGDEYLEIPSSLISKIVGESTFSLKQSMGYSAFLNSFDNL